MILKQFLLFFSWPGKHNGTPHPGALHLQLVSYHRRYCFSTGVAVAVRCRFCHLAKFQLPNTILLEFNFPFVKDDVEMDFILLLLVAAIPLFQCCWCCWCCSIRCTLWNFPIPFHSVILTFVFCRPTNISLYSVIRRTSSKKQSGKLWY